MKLNSNSTNENQKNYQKIQSGKLADAIYRNNTTFRKQLETELQKLEIDTVKAQRNLELTQIAFRNKLRNQKKEWAKQQEKNFTKMYHYVYTKKDLTETDDKKASNKSRNHSLKVNNRTKIDDYDEFLSGDDDDDDYGNFDSVDIEENKKPVLVLMKTKPYQQQQAQNVQQQNSESNLVEKDKHVIKLSNTDSIVNVSSKPTNYSQLIQAANSRLIESNNSLKVSSNNAFFVPVKASNIQITIQQDPTIFQSNSTNAIKIHKPAQKLTQSSLSFNTNSNKREPIIFNKLEQKTSSPSILKLPACGKELKIEGSRSNLISNSNNNFKSVYIKEPAIKNPESIEVKSLKSSISSLSKTKPLKIQHSNIPQVELRLTSAVINKQKFENRLKPFLKTGIEIQRQQQDIEIEQERKIKSSHILNDERFTNLVSSLGTLGAA